MWIKEFFSQIWRLYTIEIPFLWEGATAGKFIIGFFVTVVSIKIIHQLLIEETK